MTGFRPAHPVVVTPTPDNVDISDVVTLYIDSILSARSLNRPQLTLVSNRHTFVVTLDQDPSATGFDWVPTLVDTMLGHHAANEVVREAGFIKPRSAGVVMVVWDAIGNAFNGMVIPNLGGGMALGRKHLPPRPGAEDMCDFVDAISHHLWGKAWSPIIGEEDRC